MQFKQCCQLQDFVNNEKVVVYDNFWVVYKICDLVKLRPLLKKLGSSLVQTCGLCCLFELVQLYTALQSLEVALYTVGRFDEPMEFTGKNDKIG